MNLEVPFLYPIVDDRQSNDLERDALEIIRAGATILQIRAKKLSNGDLLELIKQILPNCIQADASLIVNDRVDVCLTTGASGVHLGQDDFPAIEARKILPTSIIGISTHTLNQVATANELPVDYISIGPVFDTVSKNNPDPVVGISLLKQARAITQKPIVCIGGIQEKDIPALIYEGANGIAMISGIYNDMGIFRNITKLLQLFHRKDVKTDEEI